jgi:hypothetical protein
MNYHQLMQQHIDTAEPREVIKHLTPMQMLENSRRPLPVFVSGVRTDGPVGAWERLEMAKGVRS